LKLSTRTLRGVMSDGVGNSEVSKTAGLLADTRNLLEADPQAGRQLCGDACLARSRSLLTARMAGHTRERACSARAVSARKCVESEAG
jgi:hypothetical protein